MEDPKHSLFHSLEAWSNKQQEEWKEHEGLDYVEPEPLTPDNLPKVPEEWWLRDDDTGKDE